MNGRRTLAATPAAKRETRFAPPVGGRCPCPRSLKASRKTSPLHRFRPVPGYGACRFRRAYAVKRLAEAVSGISPREDKATAMRVLSLSGKPSASWSGSAVSTLIRKVSGLRRYRPGRFVGEAAMTNAGPLAGTRRCISQHVFAVVMGAPAGCFPRCGPWRRRYRPVKDHEKDLGAEACPRSWVEKEADAATGACSSADPRGGGAKGLRPTPNVARALNPASARHYPTWPCAARFVRASCSAARLSPSRS